MKLQTQLATKDENLALTLKLLKIHTNLKMQGVSKLYLEFPQNNFHKINFIIQILMRNSYTT